jgi:hypothetical protein
MTTNLPAPFNTDARADADAAPLVRPWKRIVLDPGCSGSWLTAGDVDGDGRAELVSARNVDADDVHYTCAVACHDLDGRLLWRWGAPGSGRGELHHDVACQVHDWDGDGAQEVVLCTDGWLVELDGATGQERRRLPLPRQATDCLTFADLSGRGRPEDVLVKTRYEQVWAFSRDWRELWTARQPGGFLTAHQPYPLSLDGDAPQSVMAGYALLNADGSVRWALDEPGIERGHLDACRVLRAGDRPSDFQLALTCCGAYILLVVDGLGRRVWRLDGLHYESMDVGRVRADAEAPQIAVDISVPPGQPHPFLLIDAGGRKLGQITTRENRHHDLIDWDGDGLQEMVIADPRGIFDGLGRRIATLEVDPADAGAIRDCIAADLDGDGLPELALTTEVGRAAYLYRLPHTRRPPEPLPLGTGLNFSLY